MNLRNRIDRLEHNVRHVRPTAEAVRAAMDRFQKTGELPEDHRIARAVTEWAETGTNAYEHDLDDREAMAAMFRAVASKVMHAGDSIDSGDVVMEGLYEDAVYAPEPARGIARDLLRAFAFAGHDPSTPVWSRLGLEAPTMTCNSMAMTLAGYPVRFVHPQDRPRTKVLGEKLRAYGKVLGKDDVRIDAFLDAIDLFQETGALPGDPEMAEAVLHDAELTAYIRCRAMGEDHSRLAAALRAYWAAPAQVRETALADVRAAVAERPGAGRP